VLRDESSAELAFAAALLHADLAAPAACIKKAAAAQAKLRRSRPFWREW
jgi:hypothetical protein